MNRPDPLNYAILRLFLADEADFDVQAVAASLEPTYGRYRQFRTALLTEAVMTAEANGLVEVSRVDVDGAGEAHIHYRATPDGRTMIERLIGRSPAAHGAE